jgi:GNAT superfamily N-acetyltransferase
VFDPTKSKKDPMYTTPKATFVTRDPEFAESFLSMNNSGKVKSGSTMYPVSVNLEKHWDPFTSEGEALVNEFVQKYPNRVNLSRYLKRGDWTAVENSDFLNHLKNTGHNTFHVNEGGVNNIGVLDPSKIRGKFAKFNPEDAADPDFMKAAGGLIYLAGGGKIAKLTKKWIKPAFTENTVLYNSPKPAGVNMLSGGYHPESNSAWLEALQVDPNLRGQGIGGSAINSFEDWAKQQGASQIMGEALPNSLGFWNKQGYTVSGKPQPNNRVPISKKFEE